jgi:hypothetical protein
MSALAPSGLGEWRQAYREGRYFDLAAELPHIRKDSSAEARFYLGFTLSGLNRREEAITYLEASLKVPSSWQEEAFNCLISTLARSGRYREASNAVRRFLKVQPEKDGPDQRNTERIWGALSKVPPIEAAFSGDSHLVAKKAVGLKMPFKAGGKSFVLSADTGADLSLVREGIGKEMGLRMIPAKIQVGSITGDKVEAWLGVADELSFGRATVRNAVFLIMRDKDLTFPQAKFRLDGVLGLPVLEALGETTFFKNGDVRIPERPTTVGPANLFLSGYKPYVLGEYGGERLTFCFDSGANTTMLYRAFYRRFQKEVDSRGFPRVHRVMGVAGMKETPAMMLTDVGIRFDGKVSVWKEVDVLTVIRDKAGEKFFGNIGQDLLDRYDSCTFNWRSMRLSLNGPGE